MRKTFLVLFLFSLGCLSSRPPHLRVKDGWSAAEDLRYEILFSWERIRQEELTYCRTLSFQEECLRQIEKVTKLVNDNVLQVDPDAYSLRGLLETELEIRAMRCSRGHAPCGWWQP